MKRIIAFVARLRESVRALWSQQADDDMRAEMRSHVEMATDENVRRGMPLAEARRQALIASGGVANAEEVVRDRRGLPLLDQFGSDLRYAARSLRRSPAFSTIVVLTLALGIGANTAIFSVVDSVVLRPLPYRDPERIVAITSFVKGRAMSVSAVDFTDWRRMSHSMSPLVAGYSDHVVLTGSGEPERLTAMRVSGELFDLLGTPAVAGRTLRTSDDDASAPRVALLSEGVWRRRFGGDAGVVGRAVTLDGHPVTIVGIASSRVRWPGVADVWLPAAFSAGELAAGARGARWLSVIGRLRDGESLESARREMDAIAARLALDDPKHDEGVGTRVRSLLDDTVGEVQRPLLVLLAAVACVLLIACANVASLLLGRLAARDAELALRVALGAARGRLARQVLTEALLLAACGGALGIALAVGTTRVLTALAPDNIPRLSEVSIDQRVLAFAMLATLATALLFGLIPAIAANGRGLHARLQSASRGARQRHGSARVRRVLVVFEVSAAIVLLAAAGLLLRSVDQLRRVDPGFRAESVNTFAIQLPESRYDTGDKQAQFVDALLEQLRVIPGVRDASVSFALPMSGDSYRMSFDVVGRPAPNANDEPRAQVRSASADYFRAMGIPLVRGRLFDARDRHGAPPVVVISQDVAKHVFPNEDPIGRTLQTGWGQEGSKFGGEVIGIVGDVRQLSLDGDPTPHMYMNFSQWPLPSFDVVVRGTAPLASLVENSRAAMRQLDPDVPLNAPRPLVTLVDASVGDRRFYLGLLVAFAALAMLLAVVGLYGVIAYAVQQRRDELGIRIALGATRQRVMSLVISDGVRLVAVGVTIGLMLAWGTTTLLGALLFGVGARDPLTFAVAPAILFVTALVACSIPAWRAARTDPLAMIRAD